MAEDKLITIIQLLLGSGIFIVLLRLTFTLGQYAQRVTNLEEVIARYEKRILILETALNEINTRLKELAFELHAMREERKRNA